MREKGVKMKINNPQKLVAGLVVALSLFAHNASAVLSITMADYGVGWSDPSAIPPSSADMTGYVTTMVGLYNTQADGYSTSINIAGSSDGPFTAYVDKGSLVPSPLSVTLLDMGNNNSVNGGPGTFTINLGTGGYTYLVAGWDGPQGADQVYYIAGLTGEISISNAELPSDFRKGLSNYWLGTSSTTSVPEPTTVVAGALLLVPLGIQTIRRFRK